MAELKLFADMLQEYCSAKKTGALFVSIAEASENLLRFYFKDGTVCSLSFGPVKDNDCLEILDCYNLGNAVYFDGMKAPTASTGLPSTDSIIALVRKSGKQVTVDR